jgi:putative transposase
MLTSSPNDLESFWITYTANRQFKAQPRLFGSAKDMHYRTSDGRAVLDGTAGLWCCNAGHSRPKIVEAVQRQIEDLTTRRRFRWGIRKPLNWPIVSFNSPPTALSDKEPAVRLAVVASHHEQSVPIFQQLARDHPSGRDDVRAIPAVAAQRRGSLGRARNRHQPRDRPVLVEPVWPDVRRRDPEATRPAHPQWRWHLDEVFVKVDGQLCYLWRAVDHEGEVLEAVVTSKRDKAAALKLLKRIMKKYGAPRSIVTDGLRAYSAAMTEIGVAAERHEVGGRLNNRAENSHQPFRRRERAMQRFRSPKTLQKFSSVHAQVHNQFNQERHLVTRQVYKQRRSAALAEWRALSA